MPLTMPDSPDGWRAWLTQRCRAQLETARALVAAIKEEGATDAIRLLDDWNDVSIALRNARSAASLISQVHPMESLRAMAEAVEQEGNQLSTDLGLDRDLFEVFASAEPSRLDEGAARVLRLTLRDFRRAGVDQDEQTRARLREIGDRELVVEQAFGRNIRDDVRSISLAPEQLAGLPQDYIDAHPPGADGRVTITTDYPDTIPFMSFALDAEARRALIVEFHNRAWPVNDAVLQELLGLRAEHAKILGFESWADFDAEIKMIGSGAAIGMFIDQIAAAAFEPGRRDLAVLLERLRADRPEVDVVDRADSAFYNEVVRRERFGVDAQDVRRYFEFAKVRQGLLEVTGTLFGLTYTPAPDAVSWHEDVAVYDVQVEGAPLGRIYLDLHPRQGKYKHAAQFDLVAGIDGRQLPEGVLVCNFGSGLMEHSDVVTFFHEFTTSSPGDIDGSGSRGSRPSGTSSRHPRSCSRNGPGMPMFCAHLPLMRRATPSPWSLLPRCGPARTLARVASPGPRCSTLRSPTACTRSRSRTSPPSSWSCSRPTTSMPTSKEPISTRRSATWRGTPLATTRTCGAWSSLRTFLQLSSVKTSLRLRMPGDTATRFWRQAEAGTPPSWSPPS
jgi:thimet oligopeptidase